MNSKVFKHISFSFSALAMSFGCAQTLPSSDGSVVKNIPTDPERKAISLQPSKEPFYGDPKFKPRRDTSTLSIEVPTGSLFKPEQYEGIFSHKRNYNIGDMIRVLIDEEMDATKNLTLKRDKSSDMGIAPLELSAGPLRVNKGDILLDHSQSSNFESSALSQQSNSLNGTLNVFVKEVIPNGNLVVAGEKWIKLNEGYEYVRLSGEIRKDDIDTNNQIRSSLVGNAQIEFSSTGTLADNQNPSVVERIISLFN